MGTMNTAMERMNTTETIKGDQNSETEISTTMEGTSESVHVAIKNLANQLDRMYEQLETELKIMQSQTANQLSLLKMHSEVNVSPVVDICEYEKKGKGSGGLGGIVGTIKQGAAKVGNIKEKISQARDITQQAQNVVSDARRITSDESFSLNLMQ